MKPEIVCFKSAEEVIRIHDSLIQQFGGRQGILNRGLLESAVDQPFNVWVYENRNNRKIYNLAAAYFYHIIKNHPFIDGNKRSGAFAFVWFLRQANILDVSKLTPSALTALTILVASSDPKDKEKVISLVLNVIAKK